MKTDIHKQEIETTRVGGFGGSDAKMFYRVGLKGLSALNNTDKKRIRVAKGIDEYKPISMNDAMQKGHNFEQWYENNYASEADEREVVFSAELAKNFKTFFHADFANEKYVYELKCVSNTENVDINYTEQLQWQMMISGLPVCMVIADSALDFSKCSQPIPIDRDETTINILKNGIRLIDENWETLDLNVGEEWSDSDLMPFEKEDITVFAGYLLRIQQLEELAEESKLKVFQFMKDNNIKSLKSDFYTVTFIPESTTTSLDKKKLFTEHPEINESDYLKTSPKKAYITVKLKG